MSVSPTSLNTQDTAASLYSLASRENDEGYKTDTIISLENTGGQYNVSDGSGGCESTGSNDAKVSEWHKNNGVEPKNDTEVLTAPIERELAELKLRSNSAPDVIPYSPSFSPSPADIPMADRNSTTASRTKYTAENTSIKDICDEYIQEKHASLLTKLNEEQRSYAALCTRIHNITLGFPKHITVLNQRIRDALSGDIKFLAAAWLIEVKQEKSTFDEKTAMHKLKCAELTKTFELVATKSLEGNSDLKVCRLYEKRSNFKILMLTEYVNSCAQNIETKDLKQAEIDVIAQAKEKLDELLVGVSEDSFDDLITYYEVKQNAHDSSQLITTLNEDISKTSRLFSDI
ncbi:MAG: hypothetical protein HAW66_02120 [Shewanella sp.]|nr:hypothetical protein [Shewanella sp.]